MSYLWTSEAVSSGHPDKVADQIADAVLDQAITLDKNARVACEVTLSKGMVLVTGEIGSSVIDTNSINVIEIVRKVLKDIGYDRDEHSYNANTIPIVNIMNGQSQEIASAVIKESGELGAGDQGMMFGFACNESKTFMPLAHHLSFELINCLKNDINSKRSDKSWESPLYPDAKTQVTIEYDENNIAKRVDTVVVSTCHNPSHSLGAIRDYVGEIIKNGVVSKYEKYFDKDTKFHINPAGAWSVGGPAADTGLSGRKIVVDNYGSDSPIGGGSFSGKDPTKVDRSGAYIARYIAKNIVAYGLGNKSLVQVSYAIGLSQPVSLRVVVDGNDIGKKVKPLIDLSPQGIISRLDLKRPIYYNSASGGHFGRDGFPWEEINFEELKSI